MEKENATASIMHIMHIQIWPMARDEYDNFVRGITQYTTLMGKQYYAHYGPRREGP